MAWVLALLTPVLLFIITQLDVAQNAKGWFVHGLLWDIGKKDIVADIFAPIWVVSIVVFAALERRMVRYYDTSDQPPGATPIPVLSDARAIGATWIATGGAVLIVLMSWTREWARFGEQPDAFWYVLVILLSLLMLVVPIWWVRHGLFRDIETAIAQSRIARRMDTYLFHADARGGARWLILFTFAALTVVVCYTVLSQFDALLKGMHPTGEASVGMNGLASVFELDLSVKPVEIMARVGSWAQYATAVGGQFATGYAVSTAYLALDSFVMIPAYATCILLLLLHARRTPPDHLEGSPLGSYRLVNGVGFLALVILVSSDLLENLMTWIVVHGAWSAPTTALAPWTVRLMWFAAMFRTLAWYALVAVAILSIAFRIARYRWLGDALVSVRGQIIVVVFLAAILSMAQVEDVVRRWTVSVAFITVGMATALAVLVQWTSASALERLRHERAASASGDPPVPASIRLPWGSKATPLRRIVTATILCAAVLQVVLVGALGVPVGLGFVIPAGIIAILWLFGIPMPLSPFVRGDRDIDHVIERWFPRILGAAIYFVVGIVAIRAATTQLVFARHVDAWLVFALIPLILGIYRIQTKTWSVMGGLELLVITGVSIFGIVLWIIRGDPELSPVALAFLGLLIAYGSMPFYFSYDHDSLPSRFARDRLPWLRIQPLIVIGGVAAVVAGFAMVAEPLTVPTRLGTIAVVLLGTMLIAGFAALAVAFAETTRPPKIVAAFGLKRFPVFIFMLVWVSLAGLATIGQSNDVPIIPSARSTPVEGVTVDDVFDRWVARNAAEPSTGTAMPLVLVASSGGGIRAAAWSSYVLDCLFVGSLDIDACRPSSGGPGQIAAMSGVSGGSLGLAAWSASVADPTSVAGWDDWVKERLGDDYLSGAMAWMLLVDTPRSFVGFGPGIRDRAEMMALSWERSWSPDGSSLLSEGVFDVWERHPSLPLMVFNGTSVNDPCRFNGSVLSATPHARGDTCTSLSIFEEDEARQATLAATKDLADFLCPDQDVKTSTVVLMSARFPVITPSARIGGNLSDCGESLADAYVVDGGYSEGSGAGTITELYQRLEPRIDAFNATHDACIVPFLIQIDNGYENPKAAPVGTAPIELLVPFRTLLASQFGRIANAREQAAIEFDRPFEIAGAPVTIRRAFGIEITSRYARVTTRAHPGVQAPLGWTLSDASFDDLRSQLTIEENSDELEEIQGWLTQELTCQKP